MFLRGNIYFETHNKCNIELIYCMQSNINFYIKIYFIIITLLLFDIFAAELPEKKHNVEQVVSFFRSEFHTDEGITLSFVFLP